MTVTWNYPTRIRFGAGAALEVGHELQALGGRRVLLVSDQGVAAVGLLEPLMAALTSSGIAVQSYLDVDSNPTEANVENGAAAYRAWNADALVAVGGGSPLDTAKLIAVRTCVSLPFEELDDAVGGDRHIPAHLPPVIAIPTTAGTGSEVGRAGVLTVKSTGRKTVVFSPAMLPRVALLDPTLTLTLPAHTTAATGFDALTHCLEAVVATGDHPMADAIGLRGIELVRRALPLALSEPHSLHARGDLMKAAMMGAVAFQKGLGVCHALAHPLSSMFGLHHGVANALCLPAAVEFNAAHAGAAMHAAAVAFGVDAAALLPEALRQFRASVGLPQSLQQVGIPLEALPRLAALAQLDGCHATNPRACDEATMLALYQSAFAG